MLPTQLIKQVNEFIDRQLFPVAGIAPSIPNELRQLADGLSIEDRLLNFIDDLDQFFCWEYNQKKADSVLQCFQPLLMLSNMVTNVRDDKERY